MTFDLPSGDRILKNLGDKMLKERMNLWKEIKPMQRKSHSHSSQQEEGKAFKMLGVEPAGERDSKSWQKHNKDLIDKPQHAIEGEDTIIVNLQEQWKSSQIFKDQEKASYKEQAEKVSDTEGSHSIACLKEVVI